MAELKRYRHIHIRGLGKVSKEFKAQRRGGPPKRPQPVTDRAAHAEKLREGLQQALDEFKAYAVEQKREKVPLRRRGLPVTVQSRPEVILDVGTSRAVTRGLNLLTVKRVSAGYPNNEDNRDQATFFVTSSVLSSLDKNLDRYADWADEDAEDERRPNNFWLFESGALIRPAVIRDFWTDDVNQFPRRKVAFEWEIWTRTGFQKPFESTLSRLDVKSIGRPSTFVETVVHTVEATPEEVQHIIRASAAVVELRSASSFSAKYIDVESQERAKTVADLAARLKPAPVRAPRVAILDTGVQRAHPLLKASLPARRCLTIEPTWGVTDHSGHGTQMAGIALLGDLSTIAADSSPIELRTTLESVVVTGPDDGPLVPARDAIRQAVETAEKDPALRVFCLAQTAEGEAETGRPTSTSGVVDQLAFNDGVTTRLICAAAGNAPHSDEEPYQVADYADRNARFGIQAPAQAMNALSVGAASLKRRRSTGIDLVAPPGDLAPTSRTAQSWIPPHPHKPDIVMEGGNFCIGSDEIFSYPAARHLVLTTAHTIPNAPLARSGETSTATAMASGMAARLLAAYPKFRMETVRGLMVHSARWTDEMEAHAVLARLNGTSVGESWAGIIKCFGWGVPDEDRLFASAANALTMIIEDDLRPYELVDGVLRLREMKYFKLPWPVDVLKELDQTRVEMRCTLSYFVEPDPHAASRDRLERYPSHRLKFDMKRFGESDESAQQRFNTLANDDSGLGQVSDEGWMLGPTKQRGTLHQDIWRGSAFQLAERDGISVVPVRGWWGDMPNGNYDERTVRFSLIVSIHTPETSGDLANEALARVNAKLLVENASAIAKV